MRPTALGYLGIVSPRASDWTQFGPELLGTELAPTEEDGTVQLRTDDRHHRIAIHPGEVDGCAYFGWELANYEAFEAYVDRLKHDGLDPREATPAETAQRRVRRMVWLVDADGFRHEFFYGQAEIPKSFHPGRAMRGFELGTGLGHVAIAVSDLDRARRFFVDQLGFLVTDEIDAHLPLQFFHLSSRHHCLAIGHTPGGSGLLHLALTVNDIDDVGIAYDLCEAADTPIRRTIGRHTNDRTISFYTGTPSGFDIEYGAHSIEIEPGAHTTAVMQSASIWGHRQLTPSSCLPPTASSP